MKNKKENLALGILGAFIGGMIATIPWVVTYVYGDMILSLLAVLIGMGAIYGYQKFGGVANSKLPIIIIIVTFICVTIATLITIPLLLLGNEGADMSFYNLKVLYGLDEFIGSIIKDYVISLIFAFLGISGVISNIKQQLKEDPDRKTINLSRKKKQPKVAEEE